MYPYYTQNKEEKAKTLALSSKAEVSANKDDEDFSKYVLQMILSAIEQENYDMMYYNQLLNYTTDEEEKEVLRRIYLDDIKHFNLLKELYKCLTDEPISFDYDEIEIGDNITKEFKNSFEQKLENVELYRNILKSFLDTCIRDMLFEIITDEQMHAQKLNNLYNNRRIR